MFKTRASSCQALDGSKVASQIIRVHNGRSRASAMGRSRPIAIVSLQLILLKPTSFLRTPN